MKETQINNIRLSAHFQLNEFLRLDKYPDNVPTIYQFAAMVYGCQHLLEPARTEVGPIIINSGFRNPRVNALVGGVRNSQHLMGQAADIRPKDPQQFQHFVDNRTYITGKQLPHVKYSSKRSDSLRFNLYFCHAIDDFA